MKVFLSHSSKDKGFVESVAEILRPGTFELDSQTFDAGLVNSEAIIKSLQRCDLFCLFLSSNSVTSPYVNFETLLGIEFFASGKIGRFLVICIDDSVFEVAATNVKFFNVLRKSTEVESTARLIQGNLISSAKTNTIQARPFIGREDELVELGRQVTDHKRPPSKVLFLSGNFGAGRRTIAQKFYEDHYPKVGSIFPVINIEPFSGLEELYRKILITLRPAITVAQLSVRIKEYDIALIKEKYNIIAQLLNSLLPANEVALFVDKGGVLTDAGGFVSEINEIISCLESRPHPPVIIVSPRMIPKKLKRLEDDVSYLAVKSLKRNSTERLISRLIKDQEIQVTDAALNELIQLSDGHPFNIYRMVEELVERGLQAFLANPSDFIDWKHRQSSEYLNKIDLSNEDVLILGLLNLIPELDFTAIITALKVDANAASEALLRLTNLHIVESSAELFIISSVLRVAIERDSRIRLPQDLQRTALQVLAQSLSIRLEEGTAPVALVDAAVLASLESEGNMSRLAAAFLLPSHNVWMAKRHYDQRNWEESIRYAKEALKGSSRLSSDAFVAACRFLCLTAARIGDMETFDDGIAKLGNAARDDWARSNISFLKGFNLKLKGNLPQAEALFRQAYVFSPGNLSAVRELAAICLWCNKLDEAERFAREAHSHAQNNRYLIDILISVLIRKHRRGANKMSEINDLFDKLEKVGEEGGRSFFTTRKAEFEHLFGDNNKALNLIEVAINKTPTIFEPRRLHAEILLKNGNKVKALETINIMRDIVNSRDPNERRASYRPYLETYAHYLTEIGNYKKAKEIYDDTLAFTNEDRIQAVREIEVVQGYRSR